ncbi:MAG TPA: dihydrofolate reductase family protein [Nitrospira sp.]|nr:dihydrofolate reductase family protein [Nitrospira sp.]
MRIWTVYDGSEPASPISLPETLRRCYDGDLVFSPAPRNRPLVIGNFVQTLDGVVSFKIPGQSGGGEISGRNEADTFVMGLLRSCADAVLVGEGTFRNGPGHVWTAGYIYPKLEREFETFRMHRGKKSAHPLNVIVSGLGHVSLNEPLFRRHDVDSLVLTTGRGESALKSKYGPVLPVPVHVLPGEELSNPRDMLALLYDRYGVKLLLHEGGPMLFSSFLREGVVDELFLTVAPQIVGEGARRERPNFSGPISWGPDDALWGRLLSIKRAGSGHLFLRYRFHST